MCKLGFRQNFRALEIKSQLVSSVYLVIKRFNSGIIRELFVSFNLNQILIKVKFPRFSGIKIFGGVSRFQLSYLKGHFF